MDNPPRRNKKGWTKAQLRAAHAEDSMKSYYSAREGNSAWYTKRITKFPDELKALLNLQQDKAFLVGVAQKVAVASISDPTEAEKLIDNYLEPFQKLLDKHTHCIDKILQYFGVGEELEKGTHIGKDIRVVIEGLKVISIHLLKGWLYSSFEDGSLPFQ
ncbi:hypothetical protein BKA70DRAFT_1441928 [Coprinopsis sp. MPI-PUGE-AT-0042]|nr:hypothetical protein BKA70DRAFT_1441928 [Coprinopsis sp. MPI-PUGE-AT-0042]